MESHQIHSHVKEKHFKHYLFEFIMLFLAVFLGFVAENIREGIVESHKEKEYIQSMINDLRTDTTKLGKNIFSFEQILLEHDTLKNSFPLLSKGFSQSFYNHLNAISSYPDFINSDGTIQQLKNSGGFRLIKNHNTVDSIMAYDALVKKALINENYLYILANNMDETRTEIFSERNYDEAVSQCKTKEQMETEQMEFLLTNDKVILAKYYNKIKLYNWQTINVKKNMEELKSAGARLVNALNKEYHLK